MPNQPHGNAVLEPGNCWSPCSRRMPAGSPQWPPACFTHQIPCWTRCRHLHWLPQLREIQAKIQPLCASLFPFLTTKILSYFRGGKKEARCLQIIVVFSCLAAHWNHLESFKKHVCLGSAQRFRFIGRGYNQGVRTAQSFPGDTNGQPRLRIPAFKRCKMLSIKG